MTTLSIEAVMAAMADYAERSAEHDAARHSYDGCSWGWHGRRYIDAQNKAKDAAESILREYIAQEVREQVRLSLQSNGYYSESVDLYQMGREE